VGEIELDEYQLFEFSDISDPEEVPGAKGRPSLSSDGVLSANLPHQIEEARKGALKPAGRSRYQ